MEKCAWVCEHYADTAPRLLADREVRASGSRSWVAHEPLGTVLAVMPWNFPFWQVFRFAAPALVAGNTLLLKHSPNVTGSALAVEQMLAEAGLPENVFRTLVIAEADVPDGVERLVNERVHAVTLTGSNRAGSHVAASAGRAVKKSLLELGGSDPFVVLEERRAGARRAQGGGRSVSQHRSVLPVREAVHRARLVGRRVRPPLRVGGGGTRGR